MYVRKKPNRSGSTSVIFTDKHKSIARLFDVGFWGNFR